MNVVYFHACLLSWERPVQGSRTVSTLAYFSVAVPRADPLHRSKFQFNLVPPASPYIKLHALAKLNASHSCKVSPDYCQAIQESIRKVLPNSTTQYNERKQFTQFWTLVLCALEKFHLSASRSCQFCLKQRLTMEQFIYRGDTFIWRHIMTSQGANRPPWDVNTTSLKKCFSTGFLKTSISHQ